MSEHNEIPAGAYDCWATTDGEGRAVFPISADKEGWAQIKITVALAVKGQAEGQEEAFTSTDVNQTIDPDAPARGGVETTPHEFTIGCLLALGAESREAIAEAFAAGIMSAEQVVIVPGVGAPGKKADAKVHYKAGRAGGSFMNVSIFPRRDVPIDARAALAEKFKRAGGAAAGKAATPPAFIPPNRGTAIAPPAPNSFAPRPQR